MTDKFPIKLNKVNIYYILNYLTQIFSNNKIKNSKKDIRLQRKITTEIKLNKPTLTNKLKKKISFNNILNLQDIYTTKNYDINSTTNKLYNKSISLTSTITKTNSNASSQKELSTTKKTIGRYFTINDYNYSNKILDRTKSKKNNLYIDTLLCTDNIQKVKNSYYNPSYNKFKRSKSNDSLLKNLKEKKNLENKNKKKINLRNNFFRRTKSKNDLKAFNTYNNNEFINVLLNHYPNIEKHRKLKFNHEIKCIVKDINKELNILNNNLTIGYKQSNLITPYKILNKKKIEFQSSKPYLNDENIYKFNIMAKSKILNINDIQQKNVNNFFNTEKFYNYKRSSSLENLNMVIKNKNPKFISDNFINSNICKPSIKIYNYKSPKLREIYEELAQF